MTFQEKLEFEKKCIPDLGPVVVGHDFIVELIAKYEKLRSALEEISAYPQYYSSALINGQVQNNRTAEGQLRICSRKAKDALRDAGDENNE